MRRIDDNIDKSAILWQSKVFPISGSFNEAKEISMYSKEIIHGFYARVPNFGIPLTKLHGSIAENETLKILQSSRQKRREEALSIIKSTWLLEMLCTTVADWGLRIDVVH